MKNIKKKSIALLMAIAMIISCTTAVSAAEVSRPVEIDSSCFVPIDQIGTSREEAMLALGLTEEESENLSFYVMPLTVRNGDVTVGPQHPDGDAFHLGTSNRNNSGWGGTSFTVNAAFFGWGAVSKNFSGSTITISCCKNSAYPSSPSGSNIINSLVLDSSHTYGSANSVKVRDCGTDTFRIYYQVGSNTSATISIYILARNF